MATDLRLRRHRLKEILYQASHLEVAARAAFLDEACDGDAWMREELDSLLAFVEGPPDEGPARDATSEGAPPTPIRSGAVAGASSCEVREPPAPPPHPTGSPAPSPEPVIDLLNPPAPQKRRNWER